ncbi:RhuM family protein [Dielma fastidiosa]
MLNPPNGIVFRKWATSILKDYMIKGYAINEKRLKALNRVIEVPAKGMTRLMETIDRVSQYLKKNLIY